MDLSGACYFVSQEMCSELVIMRSVNLRLVCGLSFINFSVRLFKCQKIEKEPQV